MSDERIQRIVQRYGSLDTFVQEKILNPTIDLRSADVLRELHNEFLKGPDYYPGWWNRLSSFLDDVAKADKPFRATIAFQKLLWDTNPVSATGQGVISVSAAIDDQSFREWLANTSMDRLPTDPKEAIDRLKAIRAEISERLKPFSAKTPHLKIFRVLTAFFPRHFTCIADRAKLRKLHSAMFENPVASDSIVRHSNILHRLEEVLGPAPQDFPGLVRRITFPWYLYEKLPKSAEDVDKDENQDDPLTELAKELLIDVESLATIRLLLERKKQVIFYGPPGTGKTYVAQRFAEFITGSKERVEIVQFHPSYAYEDFVEGFRPIAAGVFGLVSGPLKRIAEKARTDHSLHVLIIDEVNRGNVTKVFGELYFLLEYREKEISLAYSREPFKLPENLRIIATMNTADRSIALMDAALRRRFYFFGFFPDSPPIDGLLHRWLQERKPQLLWLAEVVELVNRKLADRHTAIGPSYFMVENLTEEEIKIIWSYSILPHLEEYFYGQPERLSEFELESLRRAVSPT
jgi:dynein-related subfamily AAA family protein